MELLSGETLAARLERGPLSIEEALHAGVQIASALESSHRAGVIHRDLKPANVMLTPSGVKLLDFGIARLAPPASATLRETVTATLTSRDALSGTLQYMAPEQLEGRDADARSDIFSFGALLYETITGRRAFAGDSPARVTAAILTGDPPAVLSLLPDAPKELHRRDSAAWSRIRPNDGRMRTICASNSVARRALARACWSGGAAIRLAADLDRGRGSHGRRSWSAHRDTAAASARGSADGPRRDFSAARQPVHAGRHARRTRGPFS